MVRSLSIYVVLLSIVAVTSAFAADNSSAGNKDSHGGLICFSVAPVGDGRSSCDALCASKDGACVGLEMNGTVNPGLGRANALDARYSHSVVGCRCCAVAH
jgi:hypothetical protein